VQWCNRLDFNVQLIGTLLEYIAKANPDASSALSLSEKNDRAIRLLDTLRLHSILYTFRDYLPFLPPRILLTVLEGQREADVRISFSNVSVGLGFVVCVFWTRAYAG